MPKFKGGFGIDDVNEAINADAGDAQVGYTGEVPPKGVYRGRLKRMELTKTGERSNNPGTPMLRMLVEIDEPKGSKKSQYNGYGIWNNQTITKKSTGFVNQVLEALVGGNEQKAKAVKTWFWKEQLVTDEPEGGHILAIGKFKINSPEADIAVIVDTKNKRTNAEYPDPGLEIKRWLVPSGDSDDDDSVDEVDDDLDADELDDEDELGDDDDLEAGF
ncbi:hypothetical protein PBI_LAMBO_66 [Gordonia phage Lambo]|uniref:Uncharacterized protein n=12 Tax=Lambovirus TaxID=2843412 RepID=A0A9E7QR32_9CAUD|nr:hypothetical protein HWC68_gp70 [Gordonia phage Gibbin]YP_009852619.1 hypothetical protein HWC70_gp66 [Gordonia phage Lambo]YP_009852720.1 hypothetical protein HWC71_gp69 [Gordonia phage Sadboi]YP_009854024.1 hypothetical protein HWC82_gp70 [Gordonia phage Yikes]QFG08206.1 hypothetical protein PBI_GRETELLYN_68 [Gordonia phage GretelLyn]UJQ86135.1 hypothetical protein ZANY_66 [Gordonia phage Zany]UJQ86759.1 hypothetical protein SEA_JALEBI_67 [Gordonia phage Jalebi]UVT31048.1 hypothetical p